MYSNIINRGFGSNLNVVGLWGPGSMRKYFAVFFCKPEAGSARSILHLYSSMFFTADSSCRGYMSGCFAAVATMRSVKNCRIFLQGRKHIIVASRSCTSPILIFIADSVPLGHSY